MQNEPKQDQPFLQGSDHLTAIYEVNQIVVENKPSVLENVPTEIDCNLFFEFFWTIVRNDHVFIYRCCVSLVKQLFMVFVLIFLTGTEHI